MLVEDWLSDMEYHPSKDAYIHPEARGKAGFQELICSLEQRLGRNNLHYFDCCDIDQFVNYFRDARDEDKSTFMLPH